MKIKELRYLTGMSQSKFANYFGISVRNIQEWEQERKSPPPYLAGLLKRILDLEYFKVENNTNTINSNDYIFTVMHKNEEVAFVHVSFDHKDVKIIKKIPDGIKQPFGGEKLDLERVYNFLKDRCYEDGYAELDNVLILANMKSNDPWEWNRKTHGVTWDDYFWIKFEGENIAWEDVKWRE